MHSNARKKRVLNFFTLAMINVAAICAIKNWPLTAEYGVASVFFFAFAAFFFFIPVSLVSAELATGWPERGGVFVWVKEAFGPKAGFLAAWLLWIENVVWYPTVLSFISATLAFVLAPSYANSPSYIFFMSIIVYWASTLWTLRGMRASGLLSSVGVIAGTIIPGIVIILMGIYWMLRGLPTATEFSVDAMIPNFASLDDISLLVGVMLSFAGMEMSAVHAREVENPQRDYPKAIFLSALLILGLSVLGTLAISMVLSPQEIALHSGGMEAISVFLKAYKLDWSIPIFSILVALGAFGTMATWIAGPPKALLAAAQSGDLPPVFHKINKNMMPVSLMLIQGVIVTFISLIVFVMPSVSSSFWILLNLASQVYLVMYMMLFAAAIRLRYKFPHVPRAYRVPGGSFGMWITGTVGFLASLFSLILGFFPPSQLETGSIYFYEGFLVIGLSALCASPYVILLFKKPSWDEVKTPTEFFDI